MIIASVRHRYTEILIVWGIIGLAGHLLSGRSPFVTCLDVAMLIFLCTMLWLRRRSGRTPADAAETHRP